MLSVKTKINIKSQNATQSMSRVSCLEVDLMGPVVKGRMENQKTANCPMERQIRMRKKDASNLSLNPKKKRRKN